MKTPVWIPATLLFLAACNSAPPAPAPAPIETPLVLDSFAATPNPLPQNQGTLFNWTILGGSGEVTCQVDVNSDGTVEYTLEECTSATKQPHLYQAPGTYSAKLKVTDESGVSQEKSTTVTVLPVNKGPQIMRFEAEKGKTDLTARILFTVFDKEGDIVTCRLDTTNDGEWDYEFTPCRPNAFSNGVSITPANTGGVVEVTYPAKGSFTAKLEAFDAYGNDVDVLPLELPYITLPPPGACEVTNLSNTAVGSLRYWVESGRCRVVTFYPGLEGSIWLKNNDIDITQDITIIGPGPDKISVYGEDDVRHFRIFGGDVAISGLTLRDGRATLGGSIRTTGDSLSLSNMVFKNNRADDTGGTDNGGAIYLDGGTLTIANSRFENNFADDEGGAIYGTLFSGQIDISNSVFSQNTAREDGGAIYHLSTSDINLRDTNFVGNASTTDDGGAIYKWFGAININGGSFAGNQADDGGGAILLFGGLDIAAQGTSFVNNQANGNGGAIYHFTSDDVRLNNTRFSNNFSADEGGAIYKVLGDDLLVNNSVFEGNQANGDAGAVRHAGDDLTIENSTFTGNRADANNNGSGDGGALYNDGDDGTITDSTFSNNSAGNDGGAFYNEGDDVTINTSTFSNNSAGDDAGAIYNENDDLTINDSTFSNNSAGDDGGAIRNISDANNNILTVNNSIFSGNFANDNGGAIHTEDPLTITGTVTAGVYTSRFLNNRADADSNNAGNGGAIFRNDTSSTFSISGTSFTGNTAYNGGAIYRDGTNTLNLNFTGNLVNLISGNTAANRGGGVFNNDNDANFLTVPAAVSPLIITNNTCNGAAPCGGGVYRTGGTIAGDAASAISGNVGSDVSP